MVRRLTEYHPLVPFLGDYQRSVLLAEMEREIGFSHQALKKYLALLVGKGILTEERKPKNLIYRINRGNAMVLHYIVAAERMALEEFLGRSQMLKRLYEMLSPCAGKTNVLVFGSSAKGVVGEDIDLLAIGKSPPEDVVGRFEKTYGKKIHLIFLKSLPGNDAFSREVMKKHLIFSGFDSFVRYFWELSWKG